MQRTLPLSSPIRIPRHANRLFSVILVQPWSALALLAVGMVLRALLLDRPGLHPDEALYAGWALRIAGGSDPALLGVYVDKPPLLLYLLAGLFRLAGFDGQTPPDPRQLILAGRLAALLASSISLALLWLVARRAYGARVALGALALFALSPLAVRLAPTLFTDPWLVLWILLGLWAALGRQAWLAGLACGLAYATKQQALLFAPLLLVVFWLSLHRPLVSCAVQSANPRRQIWRWFNGFALIAVLVLWWDSLRWQWMPSYWDRSAQTYGGVALALDAGLPQRLAQWGELLGYGLGWPLWLALAALGLGAMLKMSSPRTAKRNGEELVACDTKRAWHATRAAALESSGIPARESLGGRRVGAAPMGSHPRWFDRLLLVFVASYLLLHVATNLAPWDRYLLPLLPLLALLLARAASWAWNAIGDPAPPAGHIGWARTVAATGVALGLLFAGYTASFARLPLGAGGAYDGVQQVTAHIRIAEPPGTILYHHWLGWHYNFYLYDAPVELRWWPEPTGLARQAAANPGGQRQLIAFPAGREQEGVRVALAEAGLVLSPVLAAADVYGAPSVMLYRIEPAVAGAARHVP